MMTNQPTRTTNLQGLQKSLQKEGLGLKVRTECGELGAISSQMFEVLLKLRKNDPTSVENIVMIVAMMKRLQVLTRRGRKEKQEKYRSRKRKQVVLFTSRCASRRLVSLCYQRKVALWSSRRERRR